MTLVRMRVLKIVATAGHVQQVAQEHNDAFSRQEVTDVGLNQRGLLFVVEIRCWYQHGHLALAWRAGHSLVLVLTGRGC
jgi:hypothetical protein